MTAPKAPTQDQLLNAAAMLAGDQPEVAQLLTDLACLAAAADGKLPEVETQTELGRLLASMARIGGLTEADLQDAYRLMDEQAELAMKGHAK